MHYVLALLLVLVARPVFAQAHPCDIAPSDVTVSGADARAVLFCAKPSDNPIRADISLDGAPMVPYIDADAEPQGAENADGYVQYRVALPVLGPGLHTVQMWLVNLTDAGAEQVSDASNLYVFTVALPRPRPSKPKVTGVAK